MLLSQSAPRRLATTLALLLLLAAAAPARATPDGDEQIPAASEPEANDFDPTSWSDWRAYTPSLALAFGIAIDGATSTLGGQVKINHTYAPPPPSPATNIRSYFDRDTDGLKGQALLLQTRLLAPELDVPSRPRFFVHAGYIAQIQEPSTRAEAGYPVVRWLNADIQDYIRIEQIVEPKLRVHGGLGSSFEVPNDVTKLRLNLHVDYMLSRADVTSRFFWSFDPRNLPILTSSHTQTLSTHEVAPGIGFDAEIDRWGGWALDFFSDFLIGIPVSGKSIEDVQSPPVRTLINVPPPTVYGPPIADPGSIQFRYERNDPTYNVFVGLRLSWVGN